tara:strand:+ start:296 stop:703 length:408 start_codon:yes stop_codon:yes gene_type:complete
MASKSALNQTRAHARTAPKIPPINSRWRVIDDPLQWILQVRKGRETSKGSGWRDIAYCAQRTALIRCIHENCGEVSADAVAVIEALPPRHPDHDTMKNPAAICGGHRVEKRTCTSDSNAHPDRIKPYENTQKPFT